MRSRLTGWLKLWITLALICHCERALADPEAVFQEHLQKVSLLFELGRLDQADLAARELLRTARSTFGKNSTEVAQALDQCVLIQYRNGGRRRPVTLSFARSAVSIWERRAPESHQLATSLHWLAAIAQTNLRHHEALELFQRSLAIRRRLHGTHHSSVAESLDYLGELYHQMARDDPHQRARAEATLTKALRIRESLTGPESLSVATSWNSLVRLHHTLGDFARGREAAERSLAIRSHLLDESHPLVGRSWHNLAVMDHALGRIEQARDGFKMALEIRSRALHAEHPEVGSSHSALADLLKDSGEFIEAERHYRAALKAMEKGYGLDHPRYATAQSNLALLLETRGDYEQAWELQNAALEIRMGTDREGRSRALLGRLAWLMGKPDQARDLLQEGISQQELEQGHDHPDLAESLLSLAEIELHDGQLDGAEALHLRLVRILEAVDREHPQLAMAQLALARVDRLRERYSDAIERSHRVLEILENHFGPEHPKTYEALLERAAARIALGDLQLGLADALAGYRSARRHLRLTARASPERAALAYLASMDSGLDLALSILASAPTPLSTVETWEALIAGRASVLDEIATRRQRARTASRQAFEALSDQFVAARTRLANLLVGSLDLPAKTRRGMIREAREAAEQAEIAMAELAGYKDPASPPQTDLTTIRDRIDGESALVAFVLFNRSSLRNPSPLQSDPSPAVPTYGAFVYSGGADEPDFVELADATTIDTIVKDIRASVQRAFFGDESEEQAYRQKGARLRELIWDPIADSVSSATTVFVVPDGSLSLISFPALPDSEDSYLVESRPAFHLLTAERDLLKSPVTQRGRGILLVGGPDFDAPQSFSARKEPRRQEVSSIWQQKARSTCLDDRRPFFTSLPATLQEVSEIAHQWRSKHSGPFQDPQGGDVTLLSGSQASEAQVKALAPGHGILHFSTHGFSYGQECGHHPMTPSAKSPQYPRGHLLGISGLALAGANSRQLSQGYVEDGILTAEEVAALDLRGVTWAVLSACETGVGEVLSGEGVVGLRRAFRLAGASSVIMSLWPVEDSSTKDWMAALYHSYLDQSAGTSEAVRQASLAMLAARRHQGLSTHPVFWGSFVASGDWR